MHGIERITLFHSPQTRSTGVLTLLEELGAPYDLHVLDLKAGEQRRPEYLAINPLGKVPAIRHRSMPITEQVAIFIYLADLFPEACLAPALTDSRRGPYLRWLVYYAACYEPGSVDKAMRREPAPPPMSPYGDFDTMLATIVDVIGRQPYLVGDAISAADILWGIALHWGMLFERVPEREPMIGYVQRITQRPAALRVAEMDATLAAEQKGERMPAPRQLDV